MQLFVIIEKFRHHMRLKKMRKEKIFAFNLAFAVDESNKSKFDKNILFWEQNQSISICVYDEKHWFSFYLYFEKNKYFIDWKSNVNIQKKMNETLKDFHKKKQIEKCKVRNAVIWIVKSKDNLKDDVKKDDVKKNENLIAIFFIDLKNNNQTNAFFNQFSYNFHFSWVINHNFDVHVVNNIIKWRFVKKQNCINESTIVSSNKSLFIKIYDTIIIKVNTSIEKSSMILLNRIYVFNFIINIVVYSILKNKKVYFNIQHRHLYRNDSIVFLMFRIKIHCVLENNRIFQKVTAFVTFIRTDFIHDWYQLLAHVNKETI